MIRKILALIAFILTFSIGFSQFVFAYELSILHSNDIHGRIVPIEYNNHHQKLGGWARRAGIIKQLKSKLKNTLVLDAGDISQGTVYYQLFSGIPDAKFIDMSCYDAVAVGNHELDKGVLNFEDFAKLLKTPLLAANLDFKNNFYLNGKVKSHIVKTYEGFKVGIIGMTTPAFKSMSSAADDIELSSYDKTLGFLVEFLKDDVDLLVLLSHAGFEKDIDTAQKFSDIDVIVGGHSHTLLKEPRCITKNGHKTLIVQAGELGVNLGKLDIDFDDDGIEKYDYHLIPLDKSSAVDKKVESEIRKLNSEVNKLSKKVVGKTAVDIDSRKKIIRTRQSNIGVLISNAMRDFAPEAQAVMINSGCIRSNNIMPRGKLKQIEIMEALPFPNNMVLLELRGSDIKAILESSVSKLPKPNRSFLQTKGLSYEVNLKSDSQFISEDMSNLVKIGNRVCNIHISGKPLKMNESYVVLTTDFLASGGDGYFQFRNAKLVSRSNLPVTTAVIKYIQKKKTVNPQVKDKIILKE